MVKLQLGDRLSVVAMVAGVLLPAAQSEAAPGTLSDIPLFLSTRADPNIMLLIDNSGSMSNIVPDTPYAKDDPATVGDEYDCPVTERLASGSQVDIRVTSSGVPYFNYNETDYDWGTAGGNGVNGNPAKCFDPSASYNARLFGDSTDAPYSPGGYLSARYTGHYLNWYFGSDVAGMTYLSQSPDWGTGTLRKKPGTSRRMEIAQGAAVDLVNSLNDVRVGLASYDAAAGAHILVGVSDIAATRSTLSNAINGLSPSGSTPLAESLHEIGRYFVGQGGTIGPGHQSSASCLSNGQYDGNLLLHPGTLSELVKDDDTLFDRNPRYATGVSNESPICFFCQKNFAILLTDGRPQSDLDISALTGLQDYDGDCSVIGADCGTDDKKNSRVYESAGSDFLDDVAKALYEIDLRPDIDGDIDGDGVLDEALNNIVTYTIGFADDQVINDQLMQDTANNGGGLFMTAADSGSLSKAFKQAATDILGRVGNASSVAFTAGKLTSNSQLYLALFNSNQWSGKLHAYALDPATGNVASNDTWEAGALLDSRNLSTDPRNIFTYNGTSGMAFEASTAAWSSMATAQKADLCAGIAGCDPATSPVAMVADRINFLRGDRSKEGLGGLRQRVSRLGDIIHSNPVYVGKPELGWPDVTPFPTAAGERYSTFKAAQKNRMGMLYAGANDGMLHGFAASNCANPGAANPGGLKICGSEQMAYVPLSTASTGAGAGLHHLTEPGYSHRYYVDLTPVVSDVYIKNNTTWTAAWRTVLVGGLRGGGRGYFALDVTDPSSFSSDDVLWEFNNSDDADLGYSFSSPVIALSNSLNLAGKPQWVAIFGNGYNDTGSGEAKLFVVPLENGLDGSWSATDYYELSTGVGSPSDRNGLSSPAVIDTDGDGDADRVYAGDLKGNLWVFDISSGDTTKWGLNNNQGKPLFAAGSAQPVVAAPIIIKHPTIRDKKNREPNVMVLFGTGQYLTAADISDTSTQAFYGVWDDGSVGLSTGNLLNQMEDSNSTASIRIMQDVAVDYLNSDSSLAKHGWYITLGSGTGNAGERVVVSAFTRGDIVYFNTLIPSSDPCANGGGGWLMGVKTVNGGRPDQPIYDRSGDGLVNDSDRVNNLAPSGEKIAQGIPAPSAFLGNKQYTPVSTLKDATGINIRRIEKLNLRGTGRLSWEEVIVD